MRFGSLFAGIGGFDLGLERAGMKCSWQVEIDDYCKRVLQKHWPNVARHSDVRLCGKHNLEPVDLICGGFPCQDISNAGKQAGIDGERSGLWSEFARIICELRPRCVVVENVSALAVRGLGRVLGDLAASGYDAEWDCLPAFAFGAPHRRDRMFIVAYPSREKSSVECLSKQLRPRGFGAGISQTTSRQNWMAREPVMDRVVDGVSFALDRNTRLGNAVVPQIAEWIGRRILEADAKP